MEFQCNEETRGLTACDYAVVEGERKRQGPAHGGLAMVRHHLLRDPAGSDDRHLGWDNDEVGKAPADHSEIG